MIVWWEDVLDKFPVWVANLMVSEVPRILEEELVQKGVIPLISRIRIRTLLKPRM